MSYTQSSQEWEELPKFNVRFSSTSKHHTSTAFQVNGLQFPDLSQMSSCTSRQNRCDMSLITRKERQKEKNQEKKLARCYLGLPISFPFFVCRCRWRCAEKPCFSTESSIFGITNTLLVSEKDRIS